MGLFLSLCLNAQMVDGIGVIVGDKAITLVEIKNEMNILHVDEKSATKLLIRRALESIEIEKRGIKVTDEEVFEDIKITAKRNNMSVDQFYTAIRESNGLTSSQLKQKIKQKIESQKLYNAISYSLITQPTDGELKEYFELHKDKFIHPSSFDVISYSSYDKNILLKKLQNPMFISPDISVKEQTLVYEKLPRPLATLLEGTQDETFTKIIPAGANSFVMFYLKAKNTTTDVVFEDVKDEIKSLLMAQKREKILSDYFQRLQNNDNIKILRRLDAK